MTARDGEGESEPAQDEPDRCWACGGRLLAHTLKRTVDGSSMLVCPPPIPPETA